MPIDPDMAELLQIFVEESMEGLDRMETGLLNLGNEDINPDTINAIFRAAHSIKGGSAIIGVTEVSEFAHRVETMLDEIRKGQRQAAGSAIKLLLESVDCIRNMLIDLQASGDVNTKRSKELLQAFEHMIDEPSGDEGNSVDVGDQANEDDNSTIPAESQPQEKPEKLEKPILRPVRSVKKNTTTGSIRVNIAKIDTLINQVGELVITQSILNRIGKQEECRFVDSYQEILAQLERNTRNLKESVMQIRMLPIKSVFNRFPRLVHDISQKLGKDVELRISGERTELDMILLEKLGDPLVHLVRNSLDHGVEIPGIRAASGKPPTGILELRAYQQASSIVIEIRDDGAGINRGKVLEKARAMGLVGPSEVLSEERIDNLIFEPGFSTADQVSDLSGRGVGMDVVRKNIEDLGGQVLVQSRAGKGCTFTIRLPLTLAMIDGQLVRVGKEIFVIPISSMVESIRIDPKQVHAIAGTAKFYRLREQYFPILRIGELFSITSHSPEIKPGILVIVDVQENRIGLLVDELMEQQNFVIKSLENNFRQIDGLSGATILGDGKVALILDVPGLARLFINSEGVNAPASFSVA